MSGTGKRQSAEKLLSGKWGRDPDFQGGRKGGFRGHIWAVFRFFFAMALPTICSESDLSQKCHFFSEVFKALTAEAIVSYCFKIFIILMRIYGKPLTAGRYGHNLVTVRTQHLVSSQRGRRGHFWHSPRLVARAVGRPLFLSRMCSKTTIGLHFWGISGSP